MANEEELFPIDIHYNKLLDWLIDRRHCDNKWHSLAKLLRQRVSTAIQNLPPSNERLKELTQSSNFNYFHTLQVLEQLKSSEGEGKSLFGHYTSPLVKEWAEISRSYEKDNLYLAECAQQLTRSVNYEVPSLKQQLAKCQQTQRDCLRKEGELSASAAALREKFEVSCKEMEIKVYQTKGHQPSILDHGWCGRYCYGMMKLL